MNRNKVSKNLLLARKKSRRGFTLVELVVVIAIIAVLAAVSVAGYFGFTDNARKSVSRQETKELLTNYQAWYISEYDHKNDLFHNLDNFRDYMVVNAEFSSDPNKNRSINYYVEAENLTADYHVEMYYRASNGTISVTELIADSSQLTGGVGTTEVYKTLDDAIKTSGINNNGTIYGTDVSIVPDESFQYKTDQNGTVTTNEYIYMAYVYSGGSQDTQSVPYNEDTPYSVSDLPEKSIIEMAISKTDNQDALIGSNLYELTEITKKNVYDKLEDYYINYYSYNEMPDGDDKNYVYNYLILPAADSTSTDFMENYLEGKANQFLKFRNGQKLIFENNITQTVVSLSNDGSSNQITARVPGEVRLKASNSSSVQDAPEVFNKKTFSSKYGFTNSAYISFGNNAGTIEGVTPDLNAALANANDKGQGVVINPSFAEKNNDLSLGGEIKDNASLVLGIEEGKFTGNQFSNASSTKKIYDDSKNKAAKYSVTLTDDLIVSGELEVGGSRIVKGQVYTGFTDDFVELIIPEGKTLTVKKGGTLKAYGRITGDGKIIVEDGGAVLEPMELQDWKGGTSSTAVLSKDIMPFNKYSPSNITADLVLEKGSEYKLSTSVTMGGLRVSLNVDFIGTNGIFSIDSGSATKSFDKTTGKMTITTEGVITDNNTVINVPGFGSLNASDCFFPLYNTDIIISSGKIDLDNLKLKVMPGSSIQVASGAELNIGKGSELAIYTKNNGAIALYDDPQYASFNSSFSNFEDGKLIVNGTLNVSGAIGGSVSAPANASISILNGAVTSISIREGIAINGNFVEETATLSYNKIIIE